MSALLAAALLLAAPAPAPEAAPIVAGVLLKLPPGEDAAVLEGLVAARAGQPLSSRALRRTVTLLYQLGRFSDVVVRALPAEPGQVVLVVECLKKRLVRGLELQRPAGPEVLDASQLRVLLGLAPGDEFWQGRLDQGLARLRAALERRGYRQARLQGRSTGEDQVDVVVQVDEGPPTRVSEVELTPGAGPDPEALRRGMATAPGAVLDLDALEADVRALRLRLRREGWLRSRVSDATVDVRGEEARVRIEIEPGPRVSFRFAGNDSLGEAELRGQLGIDPEQPLDEASLEAAAARIRNHYQERGWATARVDLRSIRAAELEVALFEVDEGRRYAVAAIRFPGAQARGTAWLHDRLREAFDEQDPAQVAGGEAERLARAAGSTSRVHSLASGEAGRVWHEPTFRQAAERLVEAYRADGHLDAAHEGTRVTLDAARGTAEVELMLREGVQTRIDSVAFEGNAEVPLPRLLEAVKLKPGDPLSFGAVEHTRAALLATYAARGFLYARIQDTEEFSADRRAAALRFHIEEGPRVQVASVAVTGNHRTRDGVVRSTVELRPGDVFDPGAVARSQTALLRLGVFRSVGLRLNDPEVPESQKDLTVELVERPWRTLAPGVGFSLANGPRAFVEYSQPNLLGQALELAGRAKVNYPINVFKLRPELDQQKPAERVEGYANVGLHYPRLFFLPVPVAAHLDAIAEQAHRKAYDLTRVSTILGFDAAVLSRATLSIQYEFEVDDIRKKALDLASATSADLQARRLPEGITTLFSVRPSLALDYRDNSLHPRSGWQASFSADWSHSLALRPASGTRPYLLFGLIPGSDVATNMLKVQASATGYLPVGRSVVLALSLRGGRVYSLDSTSQTIGPKRFFLGGATTMRGAADDEVIPEDLRAVYLDQVRACNGSLSGLGCSDVGRSVVSGNPPISDGGEAFVLAKAELRVVLRGSVEAGFFLDAGNLWLSPGNASLAGLRLHAGFGLRFVTPIGPAALDVGFNTAADRRLAERVYAPHFSIGLF
ncbi:MAG: BamA/TamA family outer membrane protein [Deltaproteobacteria bacterium]|nr:BamA/TamA family outer membrane protein [Deltaproteobacteria bacterium]